MKRNYFHVKALDQKQLRAWDQYLDWQVGQQDYHRTVVLFERCLVPCALYEQFWAKYARFLERAHKDGRDKADVGAGLGGGAGAEQPDIDKARSAFGTGLGVVDRMRDARCTWTLRGWKETLKDGTEVMRAENISVADLEYEEESKKSKKLKTSDDKMETKEKTQDPSADTKASQEETDEEFDRQFDKVAAGVATTEGEAVAADVPEEDTAEAGVENLNLGTSAAAEVESELSEVTVSDGWQRGPGRGWAEVREVYRRAATVHCPRKAVIRMKWAQFEETVGQAQKAREILQHLVSMYPMLLEVRMQQIDLERRQKQFDTAAALYVKLMRQIPTKADKYKNMKTWIAMKYARFQFKILGNADRALAVLRSALKKERGNPKLYSQIIDICYQRQPIDITGVTASIELALVSKDLSNMAKLEFIQRKEEFMQEFGDVNRYRDAWDQQKLHRHICNDDLKAEAKRKLEYEEEEKKHQQLEELRAQNAAALEAKAKLAEAEGRLMCMGCQKEMEPDKDGNYEFDNWGGQGAEDNWKAAKQAMEGGDGEGKTMFVDDEVVDLMDYDLGEAEEEKIKRSLYQQTRNKEVAPTWELNIDNYDYKKQGRDAGQESREQERGFTPGESRGWREPASASSFSEATKPPQVITHNIVQGL